MDIKSKSTIFGLLSFLIFSLTLINCNESRGVSQNQISYVLADGGINLHEFPKINSRILINIKDGTKISWTNDDLQPEIVKISGLSGRWIKTTFNNKTGYIFNGYTIPIKPPIKSYDSLEIYLTSTFKIKKKYKEVEIIASAGTTLEGHTLEKEEIIYRRVIEFENNLKFFTMREFLENGTNCLQSKKLSTQNLFLIARRLTPLSEIDLDENIISSLINGNPLIESERKVNYDISTIKIIYKSNKEKVKIEMSGHRFLIIESSPPEMKAIELYYDPIPTVCIGDYS